jgi:hypothetical protein
MKAVPIIFSEVIHSDELTLTGNTYTYEMYQAYNDDSAVNRLDVCIYVPNSILNHSTSNTISYCNVLVFFCASFSVVEDLNFNDSLNHGVRKAAETNSYIVIFVPGAEIGKTPPPNFRFFGQTDIDECLEAVDLKLQVEHIRLVSHSRGHRGLTSTLMGNENMHSGDLEKFPLNKVKPLIQLSKIDKIYYLDNFYSGPKVIIDFLVSQKKISKNLLKVFRCTAVSQIRTPDISIMQDLSKQYIDILPFTNLVTIIAFFRIVQSDIEKEAYIRSQALKQGVIVGTHSIFQKMPSELRLKYFKLEVMAIIPKRGLFSSEPIAGKILFVKFCNDQIAEFRKIFDLNDLNKDIRPIIKFLNSFQFAHQLWDETIFPHHFFVAEFAHEFFL